MIFLSNGIFICVQSCGSISTLSQAQQCHCDFAGPFPILGSSILQCIYGGTNTMHRFTDLRKRQGTGERQEGRWDVGCSAWKSLLDWLHLVCCFCVLFAHDSFQAALTICLLHCRQLLTGGAVALLSSLHWHVPNHTSASVPMHLHPLCSGVKMHFIIIARHTGRHR